MSGRPVRAPGGEKLKTHLLCGHTAGGELIANQLNQFEGAAEEPLVCLLGQQYLIEEHPQLLRIDSASEQRIQPLFPGEDVMHREALRIVVLQVPDLLGEHHIGGRSVGIDQIKTGIRRGSQYGSDDRHDRGDPRTGGESGQPYASPVGKSIGGHLFRAVQRGHRGLGDEGPGGIHHLEDVPSLQMLIGPGGEQPADIAFDGDAQLSRDRFGAEGIGSAQLLALQRGAHRNVLAGHIAEILFQLRRHLESHLDRVRSEPAHLGDPQRGESGTPRGGLILGEGGSIYCHQSTLK